MDQFGFEDNRKAFSFWQNKVTHPEKRAKSPRKSSTVNTIAL